VRLDRNTGPLGGRAEQLLDGTIHLLADEIRRVVPRGSHRAFTDSAGAETRDVGLREAPTILSEYRNLRGVSRRANSHARCSCLSHHRSLIEFSLTVCDSPGRSIEEAAEAETVLVAAASASRARVTGPAGRGSPARVTFPNTRGNLK
jgi:hypothetical protein